MYVFEERNIGRSWPFIVNLLLLQDTCGGVEKGNKQGFISLFLQKLFSILFSNFVSLSSASQFFIVVSVSLCIFSFFGVKISIIFFE